MQQPSVHSSPEEAEYEPEPAAPDLTAEEVEAEVVIAQLESQLTGGPSPASFVFWSDFAEVNLHV